MRNILTGKSDKLIELFLAHQPHDRLCLPIILTKMTQTQTSLLVLTTTLLLQFKWTQSQPADLGTFGTQNDVQPGVIYSFPSEVGRLHSSADFYALAFINYTYTRQDGHQVVSFLFILVAADFNRKREPFTVSYS